MVIQRTGLRSVQSHESLPTVLIRAPSITIRALPAAIVVLLLLQHAGAPVRELGLPGAPWVVVYRLYPLAAVVRIATQRAARPCPVLTHNRR
eukprot:COSAG02_NODE_22249_length_758_cov_1.376328_1_plen_92_part_00